MSDQKLRYEEYVNRMKEIRSLSTPSLEGVPDADTYSQRLKDNFTRIGQMAVKNREFLDTSFYPMIWSKEKLSEKEIQDLMTFGDELISAELAENLDLPVMELLSERMAKEAMEKQDLSVLIRQKDEQIGVYYELMNMTSRIFVYPSICEHYRKQGFLIGKFFIDLLDKEKFLQIEDTELREMVLTNARYSIVFYEGLRNDPEGNKKQLQLLDRMLEIWEDPFYREAVPDFDWDYFLLRTLEYYSMTTESLNGAGFTQEQLARICECSKRLCDLWNDSDKNYRELMEGVNDPQFVQVMYARNRFLTGQSTKEEYQKELLKRYAKRTETSYSVDRIYGNLSIPLEYICLLRPGHLTEEEKLTLKGIYHNLVSYAFHMPNSGSLSSLLEYYIGILKRFIQVPSGIQFRDMMLQCMAAFHPPTYVHSLMVGQITECLCGYLLDKKPELFLGVLGVRSVEEAIARRQEIIPFAYNAALCHDFGKLTIIDTVLVYGRKLLDLEFDLIRSHPAAGARLLEQHASTRAYVDIAMGHHKWYDNSRGYPEEFDTSKSPVKTIIDLVLCADCMDAATDIVGRSYNIGKTLEIFIEEIKEECGTHYAPWLPELLMDEQVFHDLKFLLGEGRQQNYRDAYYLLRTMHERSTR